MIKLGKTFSDNVVRSTRRRILIHERALTGWGARITLLYITLIVSFFLLFLRLYHLSVVRGYEYRELSEENRIRRAVIHAPRGIFYDRRGLPLVKNIPGFKVAKPCEANKNCRSTFVTEEEFRQSGDDTGIFLERDFLREYAFPFATAHVLGYLTEITQEELENPYYAYQGYLTGDRLGRMGLEEVFEKQLRGIDGKELIEVNAQGRKSRVLGVVESIPGHDLHLSIDSDLQKVAYEAMGEQIGAVVASKPATGEILALVSTPAFNPNRIHQGLSIDEFENYINSPDKPLINRAISGVYAPGSVFKIVSAVAGLETGKIKPDTLVEDTGILRIGDFSFGNWYFTQYGKTEGSVDILKALARSNDIFFYKVGEVVGIGDLAKWGTALGIGNKTGIELIGEAEGVMASPEWRKKIRGTEWYLGDTYHVSIGQGDIQTTPMQINFLTNVIAGGGKVCRPTLIKKDKLNSWIASDSKAVACKDIGLQGGTIRLITEGMRRACAKDESVGYQGTGWPFFDFTVKREVLESGTGKAEKKRVEVACKTGTAELGDADGKTHAWFTAFAPLPENKSGDAPLIAGDPEISVTVIVEEGGEGSSVAGPIAKKIMEEWFKR